MTHLLMISSNLSRPSTAARAGLAGNTLMPPRRIGVRQGQIAALVMICIVGAGLRLYCFHGFAGFDDAEYSHIAYQMAQSEFHLSAYEGPPVFPVRIGTLVPTAMLYRGLGVGPWSLILVPFLLSILSIVVCYVAARYFFGGFAGLVAAGLWAILPLDVDNATRLLPDLPSAFFGAASVLIFLLCTKAPLDRWLLPVGGGVLGGVAYGLSWLNKETVVYLAPFISLLMLWLLYTSKAYYKVVLGAATGFLAVFVGELLIYGSVTGDLLYRFHAVEENYEQIKNSFFTEGSSFGWAAGTSYATALLKRLLITGPETIFWNKEFLYLPVFGMIGTAYAVFWKRREFLLPCVWLLTLCVMFNFSSSSMSHYLPLALFNRYLYPLCFPAVLVTAGLLSALLTGSHTPRTGLDRERRFWGLALTLALIFLAGYHTFRAVRDVATQRAWMADTHAAAQLLKPGDLVLTDPISQRGLEFYWGYDSRSSIKDFEGLTAQQIPSQSYVLTNERYLGWLNDNAGMWLSDISGYRAPQCSDSAPANWKLVWGNENATLYFVE